MLVTSFFKLTFLLTSDKVGLAVILLFPVKKMETFWSGLVICVCYECLKSMVRESDAFISCGALSENPARTFSALFPEQEHQPHSCKN